MARDALHTAHATYYCTCSDPSALLTERDLRVQVVGDVRHEVGLDGELVGHQGDVVREPVVGRDDRAVAGGVELRPAGAAEDLEDVEDAEVDEGAALRVVDLRALDDDGVRGEVDAPGEGRGAHQDLGVKIFLSSSTVCTQNENKHRISTDVDVGNFVILPICNFSNGEPLNQG